MRIHIVAAVLVTFWAFLYDLPSAQYAVLFLCFGLVIAAEMFNTAIESLVDLQSSSYDNLARIAKDVAAGGVLFAAIITIIVAVFTFGDLTKVKEALLLLVKTPVYWISFFVLATAGIYFIFAFKHNSRKNKNHKRK